MIGNILVMSLSSFVISKYYFQYIFFNKNGSAKRFIYLETKIMSDLTSGFKRDWRTDYFLI